MAASIVKQLAELQKLDLKELQSEYQRVFKRPTRSRNRKQLFSQIAKKIQGDQAGQKSEDAPIKPTLTVGYSPKKKAKKAAGSKAKPQAKGKKGGASKQRFRQPGQRDKRLPKPGTDLVREWHGKKYVVRILGDGFQYDSKPFRSLSGVAKHITGQIVNGFAWLKVIPRDGKKR